MTSPDLEQLARPFYKDDGPNQWPHIQRVYRRMDELSDHPLSDVERGSAFMHDAAKAARLGEPHGELAAPFIDQAYGKALPPDIVEQIKQVVREHNLDKRGSTPESRLLRAADANPPDLGWYLRKVHAKRIAKGMSDEEAYADMEEQRKDLGNAFRYNGRNVGELLGREGAKPYRQVRRQLRHLDAGQMKRLVEAYVAAHPDGSVYE